MNARIQDVISRIETYLKEVLRQNSRSPSSVDFQPRHAEHLAAAGFGFPNFHEYLAAAKTGSERCCGYYVPDSALVESRMAALGYPPEVVGKCAQIFAMAVSNGDGSARADLIDDLHGERQRTGSGELVNHSLLVQHFQWDITRDESSVWVTLARHGIAHDGETEDNLTCLIDLPPDVPSHYHLGQTIDVPFVARYDLEQGEDQEALFFNTNRRLEFRGNLRLMPSGRRGWGYPTIRIEQTPILDHRTPAERRGEYPVHQGPEIDEQKFESGAAAGRADMLPPSQASFDFLAGWIMTANKANSTGHMSSGQIEKAFFGALANARTLDALSDQEAFYLASQACRYLASNRIRRALEDLILEASADQNGW
ncbi:hypothetical protein [Burkholderia multivorans]|uniref:hypothetical protein n=1 Tax=Burkholderia multivorans TaxID=87883 RepID=UPI0021BF46E2|nr:hypothetical protein [Burkholderia multivorans]